MRTRITRIGLIATTLLALPDVAWALPGLGEARGDDRGGVVQLAVTTSAIRGDSRSGCFVQFTLTNERHELREGDTVTLTVLEDDALFNDTLWETEFDLTAQEAADQNVARAFDCGYATQGDDFGENIEIFARADVSLDSCGLLCNAPDPASPAVEVLIVDDDDAEEDDTADTAVAIPLGVTADRVARDFDWFDVTLQQRGRIQATLDHRPGEGRLDMVLFDADGVQIAAAADGETGAAIRSESLAPGSYQLRVNHREGTDFNFFDLELELVADADCDPGATESSECGQCGSRDRTCGDDGAWGPWGECMDEGECAPGDRRMVQCGRCGLQVDTCTGMCAWSAGDCMDEGECDPGATEDERCDDGGIRFRTCDDSCGWGAFGECAECTEGEMEDCYDGPVETLNQGACTPGRRTCAGGLWDACEGQVLPTAEICDDGIDNDCDSAIDGADVDCMAPAGALGDPCAGNADCNAAAGLSCVDAAANPRYAEGHCSSDCGAGCPADGVCANFGGASRCHVACAGPADCRAGYVCALVGVTERACVPRCASDLDCTDPVRSACGAQGECQRPAAPPPMGAGGSTGAGGAGGAPPGGDTDAGPPGGGGASTGTASSSDSGCAATGGAPAGWLLLVLALGLARRRRP